MQSKIVIIALCLGMASAAVWTGPNPVKPKEFEGQEGCYIKETNEVIPFGATITPLGNCIRIHCGEMIDYASCGVLVPNGNNCFRTATDLTKPYPECCPGFKCEEENKIDTD